MILTTCFVISPNHYFVMIFLTAVVCLIYMGATVREEINRPIFKSKPYKAQSETLTVSD